MAQDTKAIDHEGQIPSSSRVQTSATPPSQSLFDSISSLRALALSTLRPKHRREDTGPHSAPTISVPSRPAPPDGNNIFLDYGSESKEDQAEPDSAVSTMDTSSSDDKVIITQKPADLEVKEEGEISDEETPAPSIASSSAPVNGAKDSSSFRKPKSSFKHTGTIVSPSTHDDYQWSSSTAYFERSPKPLQARSDTDIWSNWVPAADHVRPGLKMNMDQFNVAKELILDLLGWGVSPEYVVDCGVTREAVFYTFTELNLRLPRNLDTTGLLPLPVRNSAVSTFADSSAHLLRDSVTVPSSVPSRSQDTSVDPVNNSLNHPLPGKPVAEARASSALTTAPMARTYAVQNLSDMEAQRRLELQARKAVLASRRQKPISSPVINSTTSLTSSMSSTILDGPIVDEPIPVAPTEAVDDFLKSMLATTTPTAHTPTARARTLSGGVALGAAPALLTSPVTPAAMDPDSGNVVENSMHQMRPTSVASESAISDTVSDAPIVENGSSIASVVQIPSSATRTPTHSSTEVPPPRASLSDRLSTARGAYESQTTTRTSNSRRGTKRPVAMDFVDAEYSRAGPSRTDTSMSAPPPFVRRKMGGFASLGWHLSRKCVIDLSDSEEEEQDETTDARRAWGTKQSHTTVGRNVPHEDLMPKPRPRPPTTRPPSVGLLPTKSASPATPPVTLAEKEQQIRRMKEQIAKREQERLKKLAEKSRTPAGTPPLASSSMSISASDDPAPPPILTTVKVEETESVPLTSSVASEYRGQLPRSHSTSTSGDQADEDAVMETLNRSGSTSDSALPTPTDVKAIELESYATGDPGKSTPAAISFYSSNVVHASADGGGKRRIRGKIIDPMDATEETASTMPIDGVSSAQVELQKQTPMFSAYNSPFYSYPLLRSRSRVVADLASDTYSSTGCSFTPAASTLSSNYSLKTLGTKATIPDLRPLRVAVMTREAGRDPGRQICQFEVPGGGECRDKMCTDLHLAELEPDDHETARYLTEAMPDVLQAYDESEIADQLLQARQKMAGPAKTQNRLEDTVADAIATLTGSGR